MDDMEKYFEQKMNDIGRAYFCEQEEAIIPFLKQIYLDGCKEQGGADRMAVREIIVIDKTEFEFKNEALTALAAAEIKKV